MPTPLRRRLRLARRWAAYLLALALVALALVLGAAGQLLPLAERHPERVAAWLGEKAGRPVEVERVATQWTRRGPLLRLEGLRIGGADGVTIGQAEMLVSLYAGLLPGRGFTELRLRGPALSLQRHPEGRWSVRGLGAGEGGGDPFEYLQGLGELQVIGGRLDVDAPELGLRAHIPRIDLRLRVDGARVRAGGRGWIDAGARPLNAVLEFDRGRGDGRLYLDLDSDDLSVWAPLLGHGGITPAGGHGRAEAWLELRGRRVALATARFRLQDVVLAGAPLAGRDRPVARFGELQGRLRWRLRAGGWRLDAPLLRVADAGGAQVLDGLAVGGGRDFALAAGRVDAGPLLAVAALSDRLPPARRAWLLDAAPRVRLADVEVAGRGGGPLRLEGRLEGLAFAAVGRAPGVEGVTGTFHGDAQGWQLALDPQAPLRLDWPAGFGEVHQVRLDGHVLGWREGAGWRIASPALHVRGEDYGADLRGGLWFQGDGSRPWIDLAAELEPSPLPVAKRFWLRRSMPEGAVRWLDMALEAGTLREGRALVSGDLDDWPFTGHDGLFEARGRIEQGRLRFQPDWLPLEDTEAEMAFIGNGFRVQGRGRLAGATVGRFEAGMEDYANAPLRVRAEAAGDAARFLELLRNSPLQAGHREVLDSLAVGGPAKVGFILDQPLGHHGGKGRLEGTVELAGATLAEKRWNLAFEGVHGLARYDSTGFAADLAVLHDGRPGALVLRAGGHARAGQAFEAELHAPMDAGRLLERAPELAWLKPHVRGRSPWSLALAIPAAGRGGPGGGVLRLQSDLVGTTLELPAPLHKPAGEPLPTRVQVPLPPGSGAIDVAFGERMAVRARQRQGATGVQVTLGQGSVDAEPPASGLAVNGRTDRLDALEWIGLARGKGEGEMPLRRIDVLAGHLQMFGGQFPQTRLQLRPAAGVLEVEVDGPALAGQLAVPDQDGRPVRGRFARLHWQPRTDAQAGAGTGPDAGPDAAADVPATAPAAPAADPREDFDPARIPPLELDVDDLRVRQTRLGTAQLRTRPVPGGLEVERLQVRASWQRTEITGQWLGRGAEARTHVDVRVDSSNLGRLLAGLGFEDWLARGHGTVRFDASWVGSPAAFRLGALEGGMELVVRDGQLLEVEPGAGRVLGLLSVAQLPRRLMLDFRDLFARGLAFDRMEGQVRFGDGVARTDDLRIDAPAADIAIRGSTDLRAQRFDQTIDVAPKSGNLLTVVGAMAGGPVGAAVGAAANAVLRRPLGEIGARTYHVTGPWKEPKVEVVERDQARDGTGGAAARPAPRQAPEDGAP